MLFESKDWPAWSAGPLAHDEGVAAHADRDAAWLRQELASTKQYLQSIVDEQEAASQELRAAHEEVLSSNEELQSTNEELETTKEELQSANEELTTVNEQFQSRNRELDALTDDLSNFISSADLPMVTVGRDLRIRRLTPAGAAGLQPAADRRRPLDRAHQVLARGRRHRRDHRTGDRLGAAVGARCARPRRPLVGAARAAVPHRRQSHRRRDASSRSTSIWSGGATSCVEARDYALAIVQTVREPLVVLDGECRVGLANEAFYALLGDDAPNRSRASTSGKRADGIWASPDAASLTCRTRAQGTRADRRTWRSSASLPGRGRGRWC